MRKLAAAIAIAGAANLAPAQPGTRNAIVYGARAAGESQWHFGSFALQSPDTNPITFEIGVFFFRAQGYGLSTVVYKTSVWDVKPADGDSAQIIDDPSNGVTPSDGRQGVFDSGSQNQAVFAEQVEFLYRFRISSSADTTDASAAGGTSVKQAGPVNNPAFHTADGELGYRFNLTLARTAQSRDVLIDTSHARINSFATYNSADSNISSEFKSTVVVDWLALNASWIPAPSATPALALALLLAPRRRR